MNDAIKHRNHSVDAIRGIAMLMVVLQHTISVSTTGFEQSFLFQVVWTLQLPLFMMISGYVIRYSRPLCTSLSLWGFMKRRTLAYLLPFVVWTFLVRGLILGQTNFLDLKYLLWHMDAGYWFLVSLWTICLCFGIVDYLYNKIMFCKISKSGAITIHLIGCVFCMAILGGIGVEVGLDFFCIKLTLYYFPFYLAGYFYGQIQNDFSAKPSAEKIQNICSALCLALWIFLITRIDFYSGTDTSSFIAIRFLASLLGCVAVISLFSIIYKRGGSIVYQAGVHSIQIYLVHYLFLNIIRMDYVPHLVSVAGLGIVTLNYLLTLGAVTMIIILLSQNQILNKLLFFKDACRIYKG